MTALSEDDYRILIHDAAEQLALGVRGFRAGQLMTRAQIVAAVDRIYELAQGIPEPQPVPDNNIYPGYPSTWIPCPHGRYRKLCPDCRPA